MDPTPASTSRHCGSCTLCCKVLSVEQLSKPNGQWCAHCAQARGCAIYPTRPDECRRFSCGYLLWPALGEHWRPARSKLVVALKPEGMEIIVHVDPGAPSAWRAEPYYTEIRDMARQAERSDYTLFVQIGRRMVAVLPDQEVDLGVVAEDERVLIHDEPGPGIRRRGATKLKVNDPRIV
jgi:hypothetical protein